jgi:eukaryotic-like serine/threonine-protein kinase
MTLDMTEPNAPITVGRYLLNRRIARGGMASIHIARLMGDVGFSRIVAAKRMHPELMEDAEFVTMFLDEARIASKVRHPNVIQVHDVVTLGHEIMLVQEYVHGVPLSVLLRNAAAARAHVPVPVAAAIACQVLAGLHAAHETVDELGTPLQIVHRDVSPQNVLIATDGSARLLDFGVAKAAARGHVTKKGVFKGKLAYSAPEQLRGEATRQSDIYALAVVLWEMLAGQRLHGGAESEAELIARIIAGELPTLTSVLAEHRSWIGGYRWSQLEALEPIVHKGLETRARRRWVTAAEMEDAIAGAVPLATGSDVADWLRAVGKDFLEERELVLAHEEASWRRALGSGPYPPVDEAHEEARDEARDEWAGPGSEAPAAAAPPEDRHADPPVPVTRVRWHAPSSLIALLAGLIAAGIAFLVRDLERDWPGASSFAPSADELAPAPENPKPTPDPDPMPAPEPPRPLPVPLPASALTLPPAEEPASPQPAVRRAPARPAPRPTPRPAAPAPAAELDCTSPFYFEGKKKIFKVGCL